MTEQDRSQDRDTLESLGDEAEAVDWPEEPPTHPLPDSAPLPVKIADRFWNSIPATQKAGFFIICLIVISALTAYSLHLGYAPDFLKGTP